MLLVVIAAGCGQEGNEPAAQETETGPPPASTQPTSDTRLDCADPTVMQVDHFSDAGGNPDPAQAVVAQLGKQVRPNDLLEPADSGAGKLVRVIRDGKVVAIVHLMRADGGWLVDQVEMCPDFTR